MNLAKKTAKLEKLYSIFCYFSVFFRKKPFQNKITTNFRMFFFYLLVAVLTSSRKLWVGREKLENRPKIAEILLMVEKLAQFRER